MQENSVRLGTSDEDFFQYLAMGAVYSRKSGTYDDGFKVGVPIVERGRFAGI